MLYFVQPRRSLLDLQPDRRSTNGKEEGWRVEIPWTPQSFWRLFETTGSIWVYLYYRQLVRRRRQWVVPILN